jgi:hypothetical protein
MAKSKAVAEKKTTAVATWRDRMAQSIEENRKVAEEAPQGGGDVISFANGTITVGGVECNPLRGIVLAQRRMRVYYKGKWSPTSKDLPTCFSMDNKVPHENSSESQAGKCAVCPMNQFGSANDGESKGKACQEGIRFAAVPLDAIDGPIYTSKKLSWSATKIWDAAVTPLGGDISSRAMLATNKAVSGVQYQPTFRFETLPENEEMMSLIASRLDAAKSLVGLPYPAAEEEAPKAAPSGRKRKF